MGNVSHLFRNGSLRLAAKSGEIALALDQRQAAQVNAILMQQIERHEHQLAFVRVAGAHLGHQPAAKEQAAREAAEERARVAALPSTRLMNGYRFFAHVQWCRDVARHVYICDVEFQRAQTAIKAFEKQTKKEDATMNTDVSHRAAPTRTVRIMPVETRFSSFSRCPQRRSIQSRSRDNSTSARPLGESRATRTYQ